VKEYSHIIDAEIEKAIKKWDWKVNSIEEGRLMALELLAKAGAGWYNSFTEEGFLKDLNVLTKGRNPNKKGRSFMCGMIYNHSNLRPACFNIMKKYRRENKVTS